MSQTPDKYLTELLSFNNQVAGHSMKSGNNPAGMFKHKDGYLLKALVKYPQSECEENFYKEIFSNSKFLLPLQKHVPRYLGTVVINIHGEDIKFLKLEDISEGSVKPCIMDVKIGAQTWDPMASLEKRKAEEEKYKETKPILGFCIPGYQVYNISSGEFIKMGKAEGKALTPNTVPLAFQIFFNNEAGHMGWLVRKFLQNLKEMLHWWKEQRYVHIYSSSLLFFYDAFHLEKIHFNKVASDHAPGWLKVCMIDFAHVVPAGNMPDCNYIHGLTNLIDLLEQLEKTDK